MKVYVVWTIPDYIGVDIEGVYSSLDKAQKKVQYIKDSDSHFYEMFPEDIGIDEYEVDDD